MRCSSAAAVAIATVFYGMPRFDVTWWGKLATALLMFAIPGFMLGSSDFPAHELFLVASWLIGIPGLVISWATAVAYVPKIRDGIRAGRREAAAERAPLTSIRLRPMNVPAQLRYSTDHEWVSRDGDVVRVGITDYAQDALGDVVFVQLPVVGATVKAGETFGEVESTKSVSDIYAPVSGIVVRGQRRAVPMRRSRSTRTRTATAGSAPSG